MAPLSVLAEDGATTLHPGDKLSVTVYNHPELASQPVLDGMGRVSLPLIGSLDARALDPQELASKITQALKQYVIGAAVDVQLITPGTSVFIVGPISGVLVYSPGETLLSALSQAQSLQSVTPPSSSMAISGQASTASPSMSLQALRESGIDLRQVVLRRDGIDQAPLDVDELVAQGHSGPSLLPGDTIALHERPIAVTVTGVVTHPMVAHLYQDEPLRNALRQAGGVDDALAQYTFTLERHGVTSRVTMLSPEVTAPAQSGDVIVVPQAPRVMVAGQVMRPGNIAVQGDPSLLSALYVAGGPQADGDLRHIAILRNGKQLTYDLTRVKNGVPQNNPILADGDEIFVPASHKTDFGQIFQGLLVFSALRR